MRALAAIALTACSFASVRGPAQPPAPPGDCTQSSSAPVLDMVGMGIGLVGVLLGATIIHDAQKCSDAHPPGYNHEGCTAEAGVGVLTIAPSALLAVVDGSSGIWGSGAIARCRERIAEVGPGAPPPPPPPPPATLPKEWFCTESATEGTCKPTLELCELYRSHSHHEMSECASRTSTTCFELGPTAHCAPSAELCETYRAAAKRIATEPVSACSVVNAASAQPPVDR